MNKVDIQIQIFQLNNYLIKNLKLIINNQINLINNKITLA